MVVVVVAAEIQHMAGQIVYRYYAKRRKTRYKRPTRKLHIQITFL